MAVRIPAGTVLWEEVAFRGVLQAFLRRVLPGTGGPRRHRRRLRYLARPPDRGGVADKSADRQPPGRWPGPSPPASAATAAAGLLLSWLRERSGSLAAPVLLHLTANCGAALAARAAHGISAAPK